MATTAIPTPILALRNLSGETVSAPIGVWVGCILQALPPDIRFEIVDLVSGHIGQAAKVGQPSRIIMP